MKTQLFAAQTRILSESEYRVEYIASDSSVDSYRTILNPKGWKLDRFAKNAPFIDSHHTYSIESQLGRVEDVRLENNALIATVRWAADIAENRLARLGWEMTKAGFLRAVSVGFEALRYVTRDNPDAWATACATVGAKADSTTAQVIFMEQRLIELSACLVGSNANAVARSYKTGVLNDADIDFLAAYEAEHRTHAEPEHTPGGAAPAQATLLRQLQLLKARGI